MPIQRLPVIDLGSEHVCRFLNGNDTSYDDFRNSEFVFEFNEAEYEEDLPAVDLPDHEAEPKEDSTRDFHLYSVVQHPVEVRDRATEAHQDFGTLIKRAAHPVTLRSTAHLFVLRALSPDRKAHIVQAFRTFVVGRDDIEDLETALVTGGRSSDYYIVLSWTLTRRGGPVWVGSQGGGQEDAMRASLPEQWELVVMPGTSGCEAPDLNHGDIVVVADIQNPELELGQKARNDRAQKDCVDLVATAHPVATVLSYPEFKIVMEMKTIRIGKCKLLKTRLPQMKVRITDKKLYAYVISPAEAVKHYEMTFKNAIVDALKLLPSLQWMVVKGDLNGAKTAFKEFANDLLDKTIPRDIRRCVVPELDLVTEYGTWTPFP